MSATITYEAVIGLEVHVQLLTASKLFCGDSAAFGGEPNTHISPVTLAHPGTLPVMNAAAIEMAVTLGMALGCDIVQQNYFARKNYFYPDLPKGYQLSQHTTPICKNGTVAISVNNTVKQIQLNRIHMEEDAGKSLHDVDEQFTSVDLNRAGVPLLEIVTEPCISSGDEAFAYLTELRRLVRWLQICDGNMEEGSMRCDANISIRPAGDTTLGTKVEVKNLNSIRNVKRAIEVEISRLIACKQNGEPIIQETRSYNADNNTTFSMRSKEMADDYRYFADPDLPPFSLSDTFLHAVKERLPALPAAVKAELAATYQLAEYDAALISEDRLWIRYFKETAENCTAYKAIANWLLGPVKAWCNEAGTEIDAFPLQPGKLAALINLVETGKISFSNASGKLLTALLKAPGEDPLELATAGNLLQQSDAAGIEKWVDEALAAMPDKVAEYKKGKKGLIGLFAGEVKKRSRGQADMQVVNQLLAAKLAD